MDKKTKFYNDDTIVLNELDELNKLPIKEEKQYNDFFNSNDYFNSDDFFNNGDFYPINNSYKPEVNKENNTKKKPNNKKYIFIGCGILACIIFIIGFLMLKKDSAPLITTVSDRCILTA